jgi:cytochrome c
MFERVWLASAVLATASTLAAEPLRIGRPASQAEVAAVSISVAPDGTGLPAGRGTSRTGKGVYEAKCAACHGAKGEGSAAFPQLVGGVGSLKTTQPVGTIGSYWPYATTVFDYINRAMPYQDPGSLRPDEVYAVTAYLLHLNGIIDEDTELNRKSLPKVGMPNRNGFVDDSRPDLN